MTQLIGWCSSGLLLLTIGTQILKQWRERSARAVSVWLYVGQAVASIGFAVYSGLLRNWVFIFTNVGLALAAFVGLAITWFFKHDSAKERASGEIA